MSKTKASSRSDLSREKQKQRKSRKQSSTTEVVELPPEFRWLNFRGFADTGRISLAPLTLVMGANSSGKSSLFAPLLLLKQTLESSDTNAAIVTKGELSDAGAFRDYVYNHEVERSVEFKIYAHVHGTHKGRKPQRVPDTPPGGVEITLAHNPDSPAPRLKRLRVVSVDGQDYFERTRNSDGTYTFCGPLRNHLEKSGAHAFIENVVDSPPDKFLFPPVYDLLGWNGDGDEARLKPKQEDINGMFLYSQVIGRIESDLRRVLGRMTYIGPMRDRPRRFYEHTGEQPKSVGPRGQFAYEILFREQNSIFARINHWMNELGLASRIECRVVSDDVFVVELIDSDMACNIADAGFGVSQILPILIEGFRDGAESMLIKQPEIHLNPRQQTVLAEIFADLMKDGVKLCVETHSEHLLLSLRRLIAEGTVTSTDVGLYYVERASGTSSVRRVDIATNGHIASNDWPAGFLDDALKQALALATAQSRNMSRSGKQSKRSLPAEDMS